MGYLNELREDFSEVIEIAKAAMPMLEHVHMEATEMGEGGSVWMNKAEQEAKWMFGMIDEDLASAEFEKFVSSGQSLKVKGPSVKYPSCEVKVKGPSYMDRRNSVHSSYEGMQGGYMDVKVKGGGYRRVKIKGPSMDMKVKGPPYGMKVKGPSINMKVKGGIGPGRGINNNWMVETI